VDDVVKKLEARVVELEARLGQVARRPEPAHITAEEVQAFHKVKDLIAADFGDFCGINDCFRLCFRCGGGGGGGGVFRCITRCINECVCGPCNIGGGLGGGFGGQFGGFGG
jgi:hypothetical protein